ncbi:MAG TPA: hypothetical protein VMU83_06945 [Hanamia sp.]|nr:hypothetical protein [Hanamia sp.]
MDKKLKNRINFLTGYAVFTFFLFGYIALSSFRKTERAENIDELTVKRINVVGEDGSLRMVISNETRQNSGRMAGKDLPQRKRPAGIIFFNNEGNECGGLVCEVHDTNKVINSGMSFTMDNYDNDQVVQIVNSEKYANGHGNIRRGLVINEFPQGSSLLGFMDKYEAIKKMKDSILQKQKMDELWARKGSRRRLFIGRTSNNQSGLFLYDTAGKPRMEIYVDNTGSPQIKVIGADGKSRNILSNK